MLLAVDTSTRAIGLSLYDGSQALAEWTWSSQDHHTVELAPVVAELFARTNTNVTELQVLGVALGPGSFTGLRIGLAFVKGIALARRLPVVGVPTLDILASAQPVQPMPLVAALRAGRGRLAVNWYQSVENRWQSQDQVEVLTPAELVQRLETPTLVCGEFSEEERRALQRRRKIVFLASPAQSLRRAGFLAELAWQRWQAGQVDDPATLAPVYLHYNDPIPG